MFSQGLSDRRCEPSGVITAKPSNLGGVNQDNNPIGKSNQFGDCIQFYPTNGLSI